MSEHNDISISIGAKNGRHMCLKTAIVGFASNIFGSVVLLYSFHVWVRPSVISKINFLENSNNDIDLYDCAEAVTR